jgi:hypothetical protein
MVRHDPQREQKREEGEDVQEQDRSFSQREVSREEDIEADGQQNE